MAVSPAVVRAFLLRAMALLDVDHEVSVLAVDEVEMAELNRNYRHKSGPTDVLSFALNEGEGEGAQGYWLGDIVICPSFYAIVSVRNNTSANLAFRTSDRYIEHRFCPLRLVLFENS